MAVKIRLARRGRKKLALYDIIIAEKKAPRDGRFIEKIGNYNPNTNPASATIKEDVTVKWLLNGAQPTNTVRNILSKQGLLLRKHLQMGVNKGALTKEEADRRWNSWWQEKQKKLYKGDVPATPSTAKITKSVKDGKETTATHPDVDAALEEKETTATHSAVDAALEEKGTIDTHPDVDDAALAAEIPLNP